ncbi:hypothetical protein J2Z65_002242 [Paenibacillus aceris]|uniref:Uncharacterized protein n=1 Tax=Paenibacillus aceris TaxID=869555 RepID=A0ABS4HXF6_9BACL|nr:hypothetical protein [Paenibacillus aceris]
MLEYTEIRDEVLLLLIELDNYKLVFLEEEEEEIDVERKNNDFKKLISDLKSTISKV